MTRSGKRRRREGGREGGRERGNFYKFFLVLKEFSSFSV